jgi:hypothetical protein
MATTEPTKVFIRRGCSWWNDRLDSGIGFRAVPRIGAWMNDNRVGFRTSLTHRSTPHLVEQGQ